MDIPNLPQTTAEILYNRMHAHSIECSDTGEGDVSLVGEALEYAYTAHDCRDQLPSHEELDGIVSRAYDKDRHIARVKQRNDDSDGGRDPPDEQGCAYIGMVSALNRYLWGKMVGDHSEQVSTPERAQEYVGFSRKFTAEMSKASLDEMAELDDEVDEEDTGAFDTIKKEFVSGLINLAGQTDASIIAEAAVMYRDTEDGKRSFEGLRSLVDEVVKSHKLP